MEKDKLGDRMKSYEDKNRIYLNKNEPIIIRLEGRHFHSITNKLQKPFSDPLINLMDNTALNTISKISGAKISYQQSDEISILINSYENEKSEIMFGGNIQKLASVIASIASVYFSINSESDFGKQINVEFDCRLFNLPKEEVNEYFCWRQSDNRRNSVSMYARSLFSQKQLHGKNTSDILKDIRDLNAKDNSIICYEDIPLKYQRGRCCFSDKKTFNAINKKNGNEVEVTRNVWNIDNKIPMFSKDKQYINRYI